MLILNNPVKDVRRHCNVGRVKKRSDVPVNGATGLTGTLRFTRPTLDKNIAASLRYSQ